MAIKPLNSIAGYSIGEYPSTVIVDANGNVTTNNLTASSTVNFTNASNVSLGPVGNVNITGGSSGYYLQTNGSGTLTWAAVPTGTGISNGTSNVSIPVSSGNITLNVNGGLIANVTSGGVNVFGTLNSTGNANVGNIGTAQVLATANVTAPQLISNITTGTAPLVVSSTTLVSNLNADLLDGLNSATANTASTIAARDSSGNLSANFFIGNGSQLTGLNTATISNGNSNVNIPAANGNVNITAVGNTTMVITGTGANITGTLNATGNANVGNIGATRGVFTNIAGEGGNISNIQGGNVSGAVAFATTANAVAGANVSGQVANALVAGTVYTNAQPNITSVGTLSSLTVTGNVTGGNLVTAGKVYAPEMIDGGTGIYLAAGPAGYINFFTTGGDKATITDTGNIVASNLVANSTVFAATANVSGNITAGNANLGNLAIANFFTGTVTTNAQPNITSVGTLTALTVTGTASAGNLSTGGTLSVTGNANVGNLGTAGLITATGNVSGGNLTTGGIVNATGNIVSGANVVTDLIIGKTSSITITATGTNQNINLVPTGTGTVNVGNFIISNVATPVADSDAATKKYVDDVAQGLNIHDSCQAATPNTLAVVTGGTITYNNGTSGVGANLTTTGSFNLIDGVNVQTSGTRILVKNEANTVHNGIYTWSNATVITRATDFNTVPEVEAGDFVFVTAGTLYDNTGWVQVASPAAIGGASDFIEFTQFSGAGTYSAGTGLQLDGSVFSIANTTVTPGAYGNGDYNATFTVNQQGQLSAAANVALTPNAANLSGTTLSSTVVNSSLTSVGTLGSLAVTGNATAGNFVGRLANGNSNVNIPSANGNVNISAVGNANILVVTGTGANITGTLNASGNANVGNIGTTTAIITTGNITTINSGLMQNGTSNITIASGANISHFVGGNATSQLTVTATGANIAGYANIVGNANIGNVGAAAGVFTANVSAGNLSATNGNLTTANISGNVVLGNASVTTKISWGSATTTAITANQNIASFSVTGVTGVEFLVKGIDSTGSKYSVATVTAVTDGTSVDYSTFGTVNLGGYTGTLAVNVTGGVLYLQVTPASSNSTVWTTQYRFI